MSEQALPQPVIRHQRVVDRIREMILSGEVGGGARLYEPALCERLGVSRTPVREALIIIAEDGLVEYRPNRGYVVREFSLAEILDAYVVRESLESLACRLAAERSPSAELRAQMRNMLEQGDALLAGPALDNSSREALRNINVQFHDAIVQASANLALVESLRNVTRIPFSSSRAASWIEDHEADEIVTLRHFHAQHHEIFAAICAGEGYRAESVVRGHIANAASRFRQQYLAAQSIPAVPAGRG